MTNQRRLALPGIDIRFGWLALVAVVVQLIVIYVGFGEVEEVRRFAFPASYLLLIAFVILNRRRLGFLVIGGGMVLNFLAIVSNGGLMPISPSSMDKAGLDDELARLDIGDAVPHTKNVLLEEHDTHLQGLTDRLTWDSLGPFPVFSVGDVIVAVGLIVILIELLLPALRRASRNRPSLT